MRVGTGHPEERVPIYSPGREEREMSPMTAKQWEDLFKLARRKDWICSVCGAENPPENLGCHGCDRPR